jgi:hypothetical protein
MPILHMMSNSTVMKHMICLYYIAVVGLKEGFLFFPRQAFPDGRDVIPIGLRSRIPGRTSIIEEIEMGLGISCPFGNGLVFQGKIRPGYYVFALVE